MTFYQILWYFIIYALVGWMIEVSYHAVTLGKIINRGFLNGPVCPVYGCGVLMVLSVLYIIGKIFGIDTDVANSNVLLLFVVGIVFATLVELLAGFALDRLFHTRWWNYNDRKYNLNGYICLEFSIIWGLAIAFVLRVIQPGIADLVALIPRAVGIALLTVMYAVFVADIIVTVLTILKFNKELERMAEIQKAILALGDNMSEIIGNGTIMAVDKIDRDKQEYQDLKADFDAKMEHIRKHMMYYRLFGIGRLFAAFPNLKNSHFQDIIDMLRK